MAEQEGSQNSQYNQNDLPELLKQYYKRVFPYKLYYQWLSYGEAGRSRYFAHREFSFTLKDDIYIRYQSFTDQNDMEKEIQKRCPHKIDIGAVFSLKPKDNKLSKASNFRAEERELVFDIDMTDYDEVRTCCSGAAICQRCWPFMKIAMRIVDRALKEDFGFEHRLWVYSGRRGVHCWVCDETARKLSQGARSAIAEYLSVIKGGENQVKKVHFSSKLHPSLNRALRILEKYFPSLMLKDQDILSNEESWKNVLALVPMETTQNKLEESWKKQDRTSTQRWEELEIELGSGMKKYREEIMFQYCYPRLDVNVTKGLNHLLKSPFCIHPKTGRVCVPIDIDKVDSFDPFEVPTISELCQEIDDTGKNTPINESQQSESQTSKGYKSALLESSMKVFEKFLQKLAVENQRRNRDKRKENEKTTEW
ncbi:DNA primase small subunit-like [Dendronephthya gigantea]|uniref:DNA primase small subunit-like n=1 Tax=Dendronephthya gigantea TaxID=151771 RepID=UPI00106A5AFA|nr:DNA primase small subunit-like [Dendronephthya gigantea]